MINNIPYLRRKKVSTLLLLSAAIALLLLASPLVLSNLLLQPAQASFTGPVSIQTATPVDGTLSCGGGANPIHAKLTIDAQGNVSSSDSQTSSLTNGTFQLTNSSNGQTLYSGNIRSGTIADDPRGGWDINIDYNIDGRTFLCGSPDLQIATNCEADENTITIYTGGGDTRIGTYSPAVECDWADDGDTAAQPSSSPMSGTTTQDRDSRDGDGDSDGIPDSSDRCANNSNPRCYKERTTATTTSITTA